MSKTPRHTSCWSLVALWALRWSSFCSARLQCKEHSHGAWPSVQSKHIIDSTCCWPSSTVPILTYRQQLLFARDDLLSSDKSTVNIVMDISECLILKMATGSNADDAIKKFVLCPLDTLFVSTQLLFSIFWHATRIDEDKPRSNAQAFHCQWPNFHNLVVLGHSVPVCLPHDSRGCHFSNGAYLLLGGHSAFCSLQSYGMAGMDLDPNFCVESCA